MFGRRLYDAWQSNSRSQIVRQSLRAQLKLGLLSFPVSVLNQILDYESFSYLFSKLFKNSAHKANAKLVWRGSDRLLFRAKQDSKSHTDTERSRRNVFVDGQSECEDVGWQ